MTSERSTTPMNEATKRKLARERRAKAKARQGANISLEPAVQEPRIRVFPNPLVVPGTDEHTLFPVYFPDPVQQDREGSRLHRAIVDRIKTAAGMAALLAHRYLMAAHEGNHGRHEFAIDCIAKNASLTPDYLFRLGRDGLARLQLDGEDFDRLTALAVGALEHVLTDDPARRAEMHLAALNLLTRTLVRAERIVAAVDAAVAIKDDVEAGDELLRELQYGWVAINRCDLVRIAALADINPAPIWIQHAQFMAPVLEIARFGGKLVKASRRGGQVRLDRKLFSTLRLVVGQAGLWPEEADTEAAFLLTARLVGACIDLPDLLGRLEWCDDFEIDLLIGERLA